MVNVTTRAQTSHLVDLDTVETITVLGPTIQFLTQPAEIGDSPCVMRGTIPPGVVIPMHSHPDPETFIAIAGEAEGLNVTRDGVRWERIKPGDVFHVPENARHAWRNQGSAPAVMYLISTARMGRFFQEIGTPVAPGSEPAGPPTPEMLQHFQATAERFGYWNASPQENARVGIDAPAA